MFSATGKGDRMAEELAYVLITPYSLLKSRTGGILGRLLSRAQLEFAGARMYAPSDAFVDAYVEAIRDGGADAEQKEPLCQYVEDNFRPARRAGVSNRVMMLLFRGPNATQALNKVVGPVTTEPRGDTIRGTFGDFVTDADGRVRYFEPAVLAAPDVASGRRRLGVLADFAESDGGIVEHAIDREAGPDAQTTLVNLKPDLFAKHSSRPGNIVDMFSRTGLYIVGARMVRMSVAQGIEFYGPLRSLFVERLKFLVEREIRARIEGAFQFSLNAGDYAAMADLLKDRNAESEFNAIVHYMTGRDPAAVKTDAERAAPGTSRCLALLYRGPDAVRKVRAVLGPTDPQKAEGGTVRSDYGRDLMRNGAHASDSLESAQRERKIIGLAGGEPSEEVRTIRAYLAKA